MLRRRVRTEHGAAAVEFALVLPLLLLFLFGIITFGIVFAQNLALGNSARQAARFASVEGTSCAEVWTEARNSATSVALTGSQVTVSVTRVGSGPSLAGCGESSTVEPCAGSDPGQSIRVEVAFTSPVLVPIAGMPSDIDLEGIGEFKCEFS